MLLYVVTLVNRLTRALLAQHEATLTKAKLRDESKRSSELENELVDTKARLNSAVER